MGEKPMVVDSKIQTRMPKIFGRKLDNVFWENSGGKEKFYFYYGLAGVAVLALLHFLGR